MATDIEKIDGHIKEEIIYDDIAYVPELYQVEVAEDFLVQEDGLLINNSGVQCQEIVIDYDNDVRQKMEVVETDGTFSHTYEYDPNIYANSNSTGTQYFQYNSSLELTPVKNGYDNSANEDSKGYLLEQLRSGNVSNDKKPLHHSLRAKQMELLQIKKHGSSKQKMMSIKSDNDDWHPSNHERNSYADDLLLGGNDDGDGDYEYRRRARTYSKSSNGTKAKKREFASRMQWLNQNMMDALIQVNSGMTIRGAAKKFNVPYSTLKDRVKGRVQHGVKPGVKTVLRPEEEEELVRHIHRMEDLGFNLSSVNIRERAQELLYLSQRAIERRNEDDDRFMPGHNWLTGFFKRHPGIEVKRSSNRVPMPSSSKLKVMLKRFFEVTSLSYRKIGHDDKSGRIFSMAMMPVPCSSKIRLMVTASADGTLLPPCIIGNFDKLILAEMKQAYPTASFFVHIDLPNQPNRQEKLLHTWFCEFFVPRVKNLIGGHPSVLFLNQQTSDISIRFVGATVASNVNLVAMPSNLVGALQPLGSTFVDTLRRAILKYTKMMVFNGGEGGMHGDLLDKKGFELTNIQMTQVLKKVFERAESFREEIRKNFSECGLYPLNSRAISMDRINITAAGAVEEDFMAQLTDSILANEAAMATNNSSTSSADSSSFGGHRPDDIIRDQGGLQLLSELSTAVRVPPVTTSYTHRSQRGDSTPEPPSYIARHPSANRYGKNSQDQNSSAVPRHSQSSSAHTETRRPARAKRSAAGASERLIQRIAVQEAEDDDSDYDDDDEEEMERPAKRTRRNSDYCTNYDNDFDNPPEDRNIIGCSRTTPYEEIRKFFKSQQQETFEYEVEVERLTRDAFRHWHEEEQEDERHRNFYQHHVANSKSSNRSVSKLKSSLIEEERRQRSLKDFLLSSHNNNDSISQAVASIMPLETDQQQACRTSYGSFHAPELSTHHDVVNYSHVDGKLFENLHLNSIQSVALSSLPATKTPKLQYSLKRQPHKFMEASKAVESHQLSSSNDIEGIDMVIQEEVITSGFDQYYLQHHQHQHQQMLVPEEMMVEEIIMENEDVMTAVMEMNSKNDGGNILLAEVDESLAAHHHYQPELDASAIIENSIKGEMIQEIDDLPGDRSLSEIIGSANIIAGGESQQVLDAEVDTGVSSVETVGAIAVEGVQEHDVANAVESWPFENEQLIQADETEAAAPTLAIQIGDKFYDANTKVKVTKKLEIAGHKVELISDTTLAEAINLYNSSENSNIVDCELEILSNDLS